MINPYALHEESQILKGDCYFPEKSLPHQGNQNYPSFLCSDNSLKSNSSNFKHSITGFEHLDENKNPNSLASLFQQPFLDSLLLVSPFRDFIYEEDVLNSENSKEVEKDLQKQEPVTGQNVQFQDKGCFANTRFISEAKIPLNSSKKQVKRKNVQQTKERKSTCSLKNKEDDHADFKKPKITVDDVKSYLLERLETLNHEVGKQNSDHVANTETKLNSLRKTTNRRSSQVPKMKENAAKCQKTISLQNENSSNTSSHKNYGFWLFKNEQQVSDNSSLGNFDIRVRNNQECNFKKATLKSEHLPETNHQTRKGTVTAHKSPDRNKKHSTLVNAANKAPSRVLNNSSEIKKDKKSSVINKKFDKFEFLEQIPENLPIRKAVAKIFEEEGCCKENVDKDNLAYETESLYEECNIRTSTMQNNPEKDQGIAASVNLKKSSKTACLGNQKILHYYTLYII